MRSMMNPRPRAASAAGPMRMSRMTFLDHSDTGRGARLPYRAECAGTVHRLPEPRRCRESVLTARRGCHNPDMLPGATDSADDPLEQDAPDHPVDDPAIVWWFLGDGDRANPATDLRTFTIGNLVQPLVDGRSYFARLHAELNATEPGDQVYFLDFRGDLDELLDGPDSAVGDVLGRAARRGVKVFGLLWRSQPKALRQSEEANAEFVREIDDDGGQVLLDARTRRAGSHHQKLVVIRHPGAPGRDVAFVGGIDLGHSRNDDSQHDGDPQVMDFPDSYGPRPPWHDIQAEVRGAAVHDLEHTFRERWYGSSVLDLPSPVRQLYDRAYHMGATTSRPLPEPVPDESMPRGTHAVQVLRTYPARLRRYPFAPQGERSIAHAYRKAFARARSLVYLEDQYFWSRPVASLIASALRSSPGLHVIAVVPRYPDNDGPVTRMPGLIARHDVVRACAAAGGDRFAIYDLENHQGNPRLRARQDRGGGRRLGDGRVGQPEPAVLEPRQRAVHRRAGRRSRTPGSPVTPAGWVTGPGCSRGTCGCGSAVSIWTAIPMTLADLLEPRKTSSRRSGARRRQLAAWHDRGGAGERPPGRVLPHQTYRPTTVQRFWAGAAVPAGVRPGRARPLRDRVTRPPLTRAARDPRTRQPPAALERLLRYQRWHRTSGGSPRVSAAWTAYQMDGGT